MQLPVKFYSQRPGKEPGQVDFTWVARDVNAEFDATGQRVARGAGLGAYEPPVKAHEDLDWEDIWPGLARPASVTGPIFRAGQECRLDRYLGLCNITCLAMALEFLGRMRGGPAQVLADLYAPQRWALYKALAGGREYYAAFRLIESIETMSAIARQFYGVDAAKLVSSLGASSQDDFLRRAEAYLERGVPVIFSCGLYKQLTTSDLSSPASRATDGHYALLVGLDADDVYVHDPWGDASAINQGRGKGYGAWNPAAPTRIRRDVFRTVIGPNPTVLIVDEPAAAGATTEVVELEAPSAPTGGEAPGRHRLFKLLPHLSASEFQGIVDHYRANLGDRKSCRRRPLTQEFGYTEWRHYYKCGYHMGIDLGIPEGTEVCAAHGGVVHRVDICERTGDDLGYGTLVVLWDAEARLCSYYGHLRADSVRVKKGERVRPGTVLALSGNTGHSYGAHLHVDFRKTLPTSDGRLEMDLADPDPSDDRDHITCYLNPLGSLVDWYYSTARLYFPFQAAAQVESPLLYYARAESAGGGYYPVGLSRTLHGGVHLYPDDAVRDVVGALEAGAPLLAKTTPKVPVRCLAPGYVVAARLEPEAAAASDPLREAVANYTGFVLVRHEVATGDAGPFQPFYSLYMHLAPEAVPADGEAWDLDAEHARLAWVRQLIQKRHPALVALRSPEGGAPYEVLYTRAPLASLDGVSTLQVQGSRRQVTVEAAVPVAGAEKRVKTAFLKAPPTDVRQALRELAKGSLVTFTGPLVTVAAGDVLGHVRAEEGRSQGFLHWEVFFAREDGTLDALLDRLGELGVDRGLFETLSDSERADNYLQRAELERLYAGYTAQDAQGAEADVQAKLGALLEAVPEDERHDAARLGDFRRRLVELVTGHDLAYRVRLELDEPASLDAEFDAEPITVEFFALQADGTPRRLDLDRDVDVDGVAQDLGRRVRDSIQGLTIGDLRRGRDILAPLGAQRLELSSRAFNLQLQPTGDAGAFFTRLAGQRLRNLVLEHASEWTPEALRALLEALHARGFLGQEGSSDADPVARHLAQLHPLTWWSRPLRDQPDLLGRPDPRGEVPVVGEDGQERSLFGSLLSPAAKVRNLHPVTAVWLLQLLLEAEKVRFRAAWASTGAAGENPLHDVAWFFPCGPGKVTLTPCVGQAGYLVAVGETACAGDGAAITAQGEGGRSLRLGAPAFDHDGISARPIALCAWGTWRLPEPGGAGSNHTLSAIVVARPVVASIAAQLVKAPRGEEGHERVVDALVVTLAFDAARAPCPDLLEGFVFLRRRRYPRAQAEPDAPWVVDERALPVRGRRGAGASVVLEADLTGLRDALEPADLQPDETFDVQAAFFCPNGGFLTLERAIAPEEVDTTPFAQRLGDLLDRAGHDLLGEAGPDGAVDPERQWRQVITAGEQAGTYVTPRGALYHFGDRDGELDWSRKLGLLQPGVQLQKLEERSYAPSPKESPNKVWCRVRKPDGTTAWCWSGLLDLVRGAPPAARTYKAAVATLLHFGDRDGQLDWSKKLGALPVTERFQKLLERSYPPYPGGDYPDHVYWQIKKADGSLAWCYGGLVTEA